MYIVYNIFLVLHILETMHFYDSGFMINTPTIVLEARLGKVLVISYT